MMTRVRRSTSREDHVACALPLNKIVLRTFLSGAAFILAFSPLVANAAQTTSPSAAAPNLQSQELLVQQGHLQEAKTAALEEIHRNPSSVEAYNLLGIIETEQQDDSEALSSFQQALALDPNSNKTRNNLGSLYLSEKKLDLAEKEFRTVLQANPNDKSANYNLALLLIAQGSPVKAASHLQRIRPQTTEVKLNLIRAFLQGKRSSTALDLANQLSTEEPDDVHLHFSLGILLDSEHEYKLAQRELEKADALRPGTYEILLNLGRASLQAGDDKSADLALSQALTLKPNSPDALYSLGTTYATESRPLDALDLLVRANKLEPDNPDILYQMAQISISQRYDEDALPLLEKALHAAPGRPDILSALGECYFRAGMFDKSVAVLQQVIAIHPTIRDYSFLGLSYTQLGRFDEAQQAFHNGLKLEPNNAFCMFHLGYIAELQGNSADAEAMMLKVLRSNPDYPDALLELANLRMQAKQFIQAEEALNTYIRVSPEPATGYYKLAMVEKNLHQIAAAAKDLAQFQRLSQTAISSSHPYDHLFEYLNNRSKLGTQAQRQQELSDLVSQSKLHPKQPEVLYALVEAYLKAGDISGARATITQLDDISSGDKQTLAGVGVLLARYGLYDDAIPHFQAALQASPGSNDISFDLADAYFHKGQYSDALDAATQVTPEGRNDESYLALLADIYAHLGDTARAEDIYDSAIKRNPDNDQNYLALSLLDFRSNHVTAGRKVLLMGQERVPGSGKIIWGLGLASALDGDTAAAATQFERAVDLLPEWPGGYSTLGVFYYETGQIAKAKEVLDRFKSSGVHAGLDTQKIEDALAQSPPETANPDASLSIAQRMQLLQFALYLADKTM